jgi:hypothetical protein
VHVDVPVVKKIVKPAAIVTKVVEPEPVPVVPTVKLVKQPILPPAVFQKEIFAVKNPPIRVLTYSDLCTVYPYQRKLAGCVYKKAALPEFHHPDIQLVPNNSENEAEQSKTKSVTSSNSNTKVPLDPPSKGRVTPLDKKDETFESIQDILARNRHQGLVPLSKAEEAAGANLKSEEEGDEVAIVNDDDTAAVAESSNKKEKLVIKTTAQKRNKGDRGRVTIMRSTSAPISTKRTTTTTTTTSTTPTPTKPPTTTRKAKRSRKSRKKGKKSSRSNTTTDVPATTDNFRLA